MNLQDIFRDERMDVQLRCVFGASHMPQFLNHATKSRRTRALMLAASLVALYWYGYLSIASGLAFPVILLVVLAAWVLFARFIREAIGELLIVAVGSPDAAKGYPYARRTAADK